MRRVIVVAGATHRDGMLPILEKQLADAGVDFHLEIVEAMPNGPNSMTMRRKIQFVSQMAFRFAHDYDRMFIVDAFDVQFFGTKESLLDWDFDILFAGERNAYPEADLNGVITGPTPWRYANAGCLAGRPAALYLWTKWVEQKSDLDILDQAWLNRHLETPLARLDHYTRMFYVVSAAAEAGELTSRDGRFYNKLCDTYPSFLHFSGKCPTEPTLSLLESK